MSSTTDWTRRHSWPSRSRLIRHRLQFPTGAMSFWRCPRRKCRKHSSKDLYAFGLSMSRIAVVVIAILIGMLSARAQIQGLYPSESPEALLREALDHPFGRALLSEFKNAVGKKADATCLRSKSLDDGKLIDSGRDLF